MPDMQLTDVWPALRCPFCNALCAVEPGKVYDRLTCRGCGRNVLAAGERLEWLEGGADDPHAARACVVCPFCRGESRPLSPGRIYDHLTCPTCGAELIQPGLPLSWRLTQQLSFGVAVG